MRKYLIILLIAFYFVGCKANADFSVGKTDNTVSCPKLKIINASDNFNIYSIELPNHNISPLEIRPKESVTFELINGMLYYDNVIVSVSYGVTRGTGNVHTAYYKVNFSDGETTVITLGE